MLLAIYLNDHLAGSTVGRELAQRAAGSNRGNVYGAFLEGLATEIAEDRETLIAIMRALDVRVDRLKVLGAWGAEKLGRLKPNGRLLGYSPLSRVVELEGLALGINGKLALWRTLENLVSGRPELASFDIATLAERAESQLERLEPHRLRAATEALA
jgi:hypothetical protein